MWKREARLRREYLYRKSLEIAERQKYEKKKALKEAMEKGIPLTREQREESERLAREIAFDPNIAIPTTHVDDEYANATLQDPRVIITTSRNPSTRLKTFAKELQLVIPNSQSVNRGSSVLEGFVSACKNHDISDLIILHEKRGTPTALTISHLPYGPTAFFSLFNVKFRKDLNIDPHKMPQIYPNLIMEGFKTEIGLRTSNIIKYLFPVPKESSKRICTFFCDEDYISFRQHSYKLENGKKIFLQEHGPRFEMKLFKIILGTVDMKSAEEEWVARPFINTASKNYSL